LKEADCCWRRQTLKLPVLSQFLPRAQWLMQLLLLLLLAPPGMLLVEADWFLLFPAARLQQELVLVKWRVR
jgi:hypothetical protein